MRAMGADVDNDNQPAPENIPAPGTNTTTSVTGARDDGFLEGQEWGWSGIDNQKKDNFDNVNPKVKGLDPELLSENLDVGYVTMFLLFFHGSGWKKSCWLRPTSPLR